MRVRFWVITWKIVSISDAYMCVIFFCNNTIKLFLSMAKELCDRTPGLCCNDLCFIYIEFQFLLDDGGGRRESTDSSNSCHLQQFVLLPSMQLSYRDQFLSHQHQLLKKNPCGFSVHGPYGTLLGTVGLSFC